MAMDSLLAHGRANNTRDNKSAQFATNDGLGAFCLVASFVKLFVRSEL